jgi:very-short-patch-repair endonuclease
MARERDNTPILLENPSEVVFGFCEGGTPPSLGRCGSFGSGRARAARACAESAAACSARASTLAVSVIALLTWTKVAVQAAHARQSRAASARCWHSSTAPTHAHAAGTKCFPFPSRQDRTYRVLRQQRANRWVEFLQSTAVPSPPPTPGGRRSEERKLRRDGGWGPISRARRLRKNATEPEQLLWYALRTPRPQGLHFRRQAPVGKYFPDFVCHRSKVVVELDGSQHSEDAAVEYDATRTAFLNSRGYRVLRFWNGDVLKNRDAVI